MTDDTSPRINWTWLAAGGILLALLAGAAGWYSARWQSDPAASLSSGDRRAIETVVREYILENPEIIPDAIDALQLKEARQRLVAIRNDVETPYPGAVLGNPNGSLVLVEFTDFACPYCKVSVGFIDELIAANPDLKVVVRELPILSPQSEDAALMALAAAEQGKYKEFYYAMFEAGRPSPETIEAAARKAKLDMDKARATISSPRAKEEIENSLRMARQLGFSGTPAWVVGDQLIPGAVGVERLSEAIKMARE